MLIIAFGIGFVVGVFIGVIIMAALCMAGRNDYPDFPDDVNVWQK